LEGGVIATATIFKLGKRTRIFIVVALLVALVVVLGVRISEYDLVGGCLSRITLNTYTHFTFNYTAALLYYSSLATPTGLEVVYPGSHTIYLADDQALDYYALLKIYNVTGNPEAISLARRIYSASLVYGGLFKYWNPVFEVVGSYPNTTQPMSGVDVTLGYIDGYTVRATVFSVNPAFNYSAYADQLAYRVLLYLHLGEYTQAEVVFGRLTKMWSGVGFADEAYSGVYQTYKLADYLVAWRALEMHRQTCSFAGSYLGVVKKAVSIISTLQAPSGGVWTGYESVNNSLVYGSGVSLTNGETTSLCILADSL
jgi:hypothetical protein